MAIGILCLKNKSRFDLSLSLSLSFSKAVQERLPALFSCPIARNVGNPRSRLSKSRKSCGMGTLAVSGLVSDVATMATKRERAKKIFEEENLTQAAIAKRLGVATRTVERWASADGWGRKVAERKKVVQFEKPAHPYAKKTSAREPRQAIDPIELVETAIIDVSVALNVSQGGDTRGIGSMANALVNLLKFRRELCPPTAAELAEQAIALGIPPAEFARELREKWQARA